MVNLANGTAILHADNNLSKIFKNLTRGLMFIDVAVMNGIQ